MVNKLSLRQKVIVYGSLFSLALFIIFPIYFMFIISLKRPADIYRRPSLLPVNPTVMNYQQLLSDLDFATNIGNSLLIAMCDDNSIRAVGGLRRVQPRALCNTADGVGSVG